MSGLLPYILPIKGLGVGIHQFEYEIDDYFFSHFENAPIEGAQIDLKVTFDKRYDLYQLVFEFKGTIAASCDRCLVPIKLPISGNNIMLVKLSIEASEEDADIIYIEPEQPTLDISRFVYEYIVLAVPLIKRYKCEEEEPRVCDMEMLKYIENGAKKEEKEPSSNPFFEALKGLNFGEESNKEEQ